MSLLGLDDIDNFNGPGDVVVIGSGFAGQAVASRLAAYDFRVLLLEQRGQADLTSPGDKTAPGWPISYREFAEQITSPGRSSGDVITSGRLGWSPVQTKAWWTRMSCVRAAEL